MTFHEIADRMPGFLMPLLQEQYCPEDVERIYQGYGHRRATTLRANALLSNADEVAQALSDAGISFSRLDWYSDAFVLEPGSEKALWDLPIYQEGKVYLQSLSSMLPPLMMGLKPGTDVLDMCAAPGGKTTQMAALGAGRVHITACEMNAPRAERLEHNLDKQGARCVNVLRTDARRLDSFFSFDQVLLDAPCSGSGTLHADDPKLAKRFNEGLVQKCCKQQRALLLKALEVLKPGGSMIYSTCSVLRRENEDVVEECLAKARKRGSYRVAPIEFAGMGSLPKLPTALDDVLCVCPTKEFEGFFVARIVRTA